MEKGSSVEDIAFKFIYADIENQKLQEVKIFREGEGEIKPHHEKKENIDSPHKGKLLRITPYNEKGEIEGLLKEYDLRGQLKFVEFYIAGKREGLSLSIANGKIYYEEQYKNDLLNGTCINYHYTDNKHWVWCKTDYKDGKKEGFENFYLVDGTLCSQTPYKNGLKEGIARTYMDGKVRSETPFKNGKEDGIGKNYIKGQFFEKLYYKDGKLVKIEMQNLKQRVSPQVRAEQERTKGRSR